MDKWWGPEALNVGDIQIAHYQSATIWKVSLGVQIGRNEGDLLIPALYTVTLSNCDDATDDRCSSHIARN